MNKTIQALIEPEKLYTRKEILNDKDPVPREPGIYAWYFKQIPPNVPINGCKKYKGNTLLYIGISPKKEPNPGKKSRRNLNTRIQEHYTKNAYGSTLRKTLGCLLEDILDIQFIPAGKRNFKFTKESEACLSSWMAKNAFVTWKCHSKPWELEKQAIAKLFPPLNLQGNSQHPFYPHLKQVRRKALEKARASS